MSNLDQFIGGVIGGVLSDPPTSIVNGYSTNGYTVPGNNYLSSGLKTAATGALTADTLVTVLSITGRGVLDNFGYKQTNATSRTHRVKITIDGVVALDSTSAASAAANNGAMIVGGSFVFATAAGSPSKPSGMVCFNKSLLIEYASSLSETSLTTMAYAYRLM